MGPLLPGRALFAPGFRHQGASTVPVSGGMENPTVGRRGNILRGTIPPPSRQLRIQGGTGLAHVRRIRLR